MSLWKHFQQNTVKRTMHTTVNYLGRAEGNRLSLVTEMTQQAVLTVGSVSVIWAVWKSGKQRSTRTVPETS